MPGAPSSDSGRAGSPVLVDRGVVLDCMGLRGALGHRLPRLRSAIVHACLRGHRRVLRGASWPSMVVVSPSCPAVSSLLSVRARDRQSRASLLVPAPACQPLSCSGPSRASPGAGIDALDQRPGSSLAGCGGARALQCGGSYGSRSWGMLLGPTRSSPVVVLVIAGFVHLLVGARAASRLLAGSRHAWCRSARSGHGSSRRHPGAGGGARLVRSWLTRCRASRCSAGPRPPSVSGRNRRGG